MKRISVQKLTIAMMIFTSVFMNISAINNQQKNPMLSQRAIMDLIRGIESDNMGLKISAIQMAGKYHIEESVDALSLVLKSKSSEDVKCTVLFALSRIGTTASLEQLVCYADTCRHSDLKRTAEMLASLMKIEKRIVQL